MTRTTTRRFGAEPARHRRGSQPAAAPSSTKPLKRATGTLLASLVVLVCAALAGCGQKGPLVLPDGTATGAPAGPTASGESAHSTSEDADDDERSTDDDGNGTDSRSDGR